jgi:hypothetical protein
MSDATVGLVKPASPGGKRMSPLIVSIVASRFVMHSARWRADQARE